MESGIVHYFGYGSLVNRATRPADESFWPARLHGWRRVWDHRVIPDASRPGCTSLSIEPAPGSSIDGVIVAMHVSALAVLDTRESGYDRLELAADDFGLPDAVATSIGAAAVHVYRSQAHRRADADSVHPILASYVDVVMAGYLEHFGESGLVGWLSSTTGWHGAMRDDRAAPDYPRWQTHEPNLLERFDRVRTDVLRELAGGATIPVSLDVAR